MRKRSQRFDGQTGNALQSIFGIYKLNEFTKPNLYFRRSYYNTKRPEGDKWEIYKIFSGNYQAEREKI